MNVTEDVVDSIESHAVLSYPEECCGFLFGTENPSEIQIIRAESVSNERAGSRTHRYLMTPNQFLKAEKQAEKWDCQLLGGYHSHPDHEAYFSKKDREDAVPPELIDKGYIYIAQPPLYKIKRKKREQYLESDEELTNILLELCIDDLSLLDAEGKAFCDKDQLLRILREGRGEKEELAFWNEELVREGAWVTWRRHEVMAELSQACVEQHRELGGPEEYLEVEYRPSVPLGDGISTTEDRFRESLAAAEQREQAVAATVVGPHRDDFTVMIDQVDMNSFASRGQARTLALTLRLAEAAYLAKARIEGPIVLLDDVLSEMDAFRRRRVLEKISQYQQVVITTTDLELVRGFFGAEANYYKVVGGDVYPMDD